MSTEAPRNSGTGEPIPPQAPKGGLPRFLRSLFPKPPELVSEQPIPRVVQLPSGMEGFVGKIQQGISDQIASDEQRRLDWQTNVDKLAAEEAEKQAKVEAEQRERAEQLRVKTEGAAVEGTKILKDFQIVERLEVIRQAVWGGKGEIIPLKPYFDFHHMGEWDRIRDKIWRGEIPYYKQPPKPKYDLLGGLELVFKYPDVVWVQTDETCDGTTQTFSYSSSPGTEPSKFDGNISLKVHIFSMPEEPEENRKTIRISAVLPFLSGGQKTDVTIPVNAENAEMLLTEALVRDCIYRKTQAFTPSILEEEGRKRLESLK